MYSVHCSSFMVDPAFVSVCKRTCWSVIIFCLLSYLLTINSQFTGFTYSAVFWWSL